MIGETLHDGDLFARDYRVLRRLRKGGMGALYVVEQTSTAKTRVLKLLAPELAESESARERFLREARVGGAIESDHVVEVVSAGIDEESGIPFLVMEHLKGDDLAERIERKGPLDRSLVAEIFRQLAHALGRAHAQGIVHRDLKPENVFLAETRRPDAEFCAKVLDFGVAKFLAAAKPASSTQPVGSPLFMAPEQTDASTEITPATDVWALGLLAYYLLTGRHYWRASAENAVPALLREMCIDAIVPASERAAEQGVDHLLPEGFNAWFARCVDRDPAARFADADACASTLLSTFAEGAADELRRSQQPPASGFDLGAIPPLDLAALTLHDEPLVLAQSTAASSDVDHRTDTHFDLGDAPDAAAFDLGAESAHASFDLGEGASGLAGGAAELEGVGPAEPSADVALTTSKPSADLFSLDGPAALGADDLEWIGEQRTGSDQLPDETEARAHGSGPPPTSTPADAFGLPTAPSSSPQGERNAVEALPDAPDAEGTFDRSTPMGLNAVRPPPLPYAGELPRESFVDDRVGTTSSILPSVVAVGSGPSETTSLFDLGEAGPVLESLISIVPPRPSDGGLAGSVSSAPQLTPIPPLPSLSDDAEPPPTAAAPPSHSTEHPARPRWIVPAFGAAVLVGGVAGLLAHRIVPPKPRPGAAASASAAQPAPTATVTAAPRPTPPAAMGSGTDGEEGTEQPVPQLPTLSKECPLGMALVHDGESSYCLDAYEVTVRQWARCVLDGVCKPLRAEVMHVAVRPDVARRHSVFCSATRPDIDLPVNCIPWAEADVHCRARGARLPTAREWLVATYGPGKERAHPWGAKPTDATRANVCDERCATWGMEAGLLLPSLHPGSDGFAGPTLPGQFPAGDTPDKVADLFGNVAEWTQDGQDDRRVVLGGSFFTAEEETLASATLVDARASTPTIGFRCAANRIETPTKNE